ncbi:DUF4097 domain-containing protein [Fulvivirga sp. M361]|uniref:DUF4097 family beta strand repeat-containing protein n=1 Tax=Fulvivirga sp. M361 TaxID=2594266 RepID=UPI001179FDC1|nr:DUF4097 family beta strand repeat-containing protein [Fulvivirga sp. M361]TRX56017.1 DUF4097 domain-containing protein [Fulvivirga sp. M361]
MKSLKQLLAVTLVILTVPAGVSQDNGEFTVPFTDPGKRGKIKVDIRKGSIDVIGSERKDILIRYSPAKYKYKVKNKEKEKAKEKDGLKRISSGLTNLEVSEKNNYINVESDSWEKGIDLVFEVPKNIDLHVETYQYGDIFIKNIAGEVVADNYNGKIKAETISGSLVANTYNGSIKATFITVKPDTPMAFTTYNGDVDLSLPADFKASLKMKTSQGEIYSGFDFSAKETNRLKEEKKSGTYKIYLEDWVRGDVNGGGPEIMIKNYNGDIYLRK